MKRILSTFLFTAAIACGQAVPVIFDTDMGNDIDDALALAMLHSLESRGEVKLLAVTVTKDNVWAARYVSAVNTFYGRGQVPVGIVKDGPTKGEGKYLRQAIEKGGWKYSDTKEEAVALLERTLKSQADGSVVVVQVGFSTNLARLLALPGGKELVRKKVKLLSLMAGDFTGAGPEYNVREDVKSCRKVADEWPTPMVWSGFEIGRTVKFPARSIEHDFGWASKNPVVDGYKAYMKFPYDRETWDLTSVLYAVRPDGGYFGLSAAGEVQVDEKGNTRFEAAAGGRSRYLTWNDTQRARSLEALVWLATQPAK
ncbi:MAG: nucleoside hydrolase [Acidobacteria bacterium]|nr:nucleoside hydrolase [Acidobacteriota bacterium]